MPRECCFNCRDLTHRFHGCPCHGFKGMVDTRLRQIGVSAYVYETSTVKEIIERRLMRRAVRELARGRKG